MARLASLILILFLVVPAAWASESPQASSSTPIEPLPLAPTRSLSFDTDEVTWASIDVSPDGKTLLFDVLGDLYTVPASGGTAKQITTGLAFDSQPAYSPDGHWIAFVSDRGGSEALWIARTDGSDARQINDPGAGADDTLASPIWTPDGRFVVVARSNWNLSAWELWMHHRDGGPGINITPAKPEPDIPRDARHNALGASYSPDGQYLYYATKMGRFEYDAALPMWQIARRDMQTGDEDILTNAPGSAMRPEISRDGKWMVYATRFDGQTELRLRNLVSGEDRRLAYPVQRDDQESRYTRDLMPRYRLSPDAKYLYVTHAAKFERINVSDGTRSTIPISVHVEQKIGEQLYFPWRVDEGDVVARILQAPQFSPDGKQVAFAAQARIWIADADGDNPQPVTPADLPAFQPAWSPDGNTLAFVSWKKEEGALWTVRASANSTPTRLTTHSAYYAQPAWSPDGKRIVALRTSLRERAMMSEDSGLASDVIWIPNSGGEAHVVLPARGAAHPQFGTDSTRIYLYLEGDPFQPKQPHGLISVRFDGTDRREHLQIVGPGGYWAEEPQAVHDVAISPDGEWLLALAANQVYVFPMPQVGGKPPVIDVENSALPLKQLTSVGADYIAWAGKGQIAWSAGRSIYRRTLASIDFQASQAKAPDSGDAGTTQPPFKLAEAESGVTRRDYRVSSPRAMGRGEVLYKGARIITLNGDEVIDRGDLLVRDNRIAAIGPSLATPSGGRVVTVVNAEGTTIIPGLVDVHAHYIEVRRSVLDLDDPNFRAELAYGVTTGIDVQPGTNDLTAYQDLIDSGRVIGPRVHSTGPGIFSDTRLKSLDEAKAILTRYKEHYGVHNLKSYIVGNRQQRQWVVLASKELQMMPTTEGGLDTKMDLTHALDGYSGNEHALPTIPLGRDVVTLFTHIHYNPTLLVSYGGPAGENHWYVREDVHGDEKLNRLYPHQWIDERALRRKWFHPQEEVFNKLAQEAAKVIHAGGHVGIGAHGQLPGFGFHWELWSLASGGLSPLEALRAATLHGAHIIGIDQDLGSLEVGKLADFLILERNPLDDLRNTNSIREIVKDGIRYDTYAQPIVSN